MTHLRHPRAKHVELRLDSEAHDSVQNIMARPMDRGMAVRCPAGTYALHALTCSQCLQAGYQSLTITEWHTEPALNIHLVVPRGYVLCM